VTSSRLINREPRAFYASHRTAFVARWSDVAPFHAIALDFVPHLSPTEPARRVSVAPSASVTGIVAAVRLNVLLNLPLADSRRNGRRLCKYGTSRRVAVLSGRVPQQVAGAGKAANRAWHERDEASR
jgi:hypothetical protein